MRWMYNFLNNLRFRNDGSFAHIGVNKRVVLWKYLDMGMDYVNPFVARYNLLPYIVEHFLFGAFSSDLPF